MREILTDERIQAECDMYKPYSQRFLLNDTKHQQALRFKPGSKMNMFLNTVSGARPQSVMMQALSTGIIKNTQVAEDLAARLKYVYESGENPQVMENAIDTLLAEAVLEQQRLDQQREVAVQTNQPLDQVVQTQEKSMQTEAIQEEVASLMQEKAIEHAEEVAQMEKPMTHDGTAESMLRSMTKKKAIQMYSQLTNKPTTELRVRGITKDHIVDAILLENPALTTQDVNHALDMVSGTQRPVRMHHEQALEQYREHLHEPAKDVEVPSDLETKFRMTKHRLSPDEQETISNYLAGKQRTARGDELVSQYLEEGEIESREQGVVMTAAKKFEQQYKLPRIMSKITGMFRGERGGERLARSYSAETSKPGLGYTGEEEPRSRASSSGTPREQGEL